MSWIALWKLVLIAAVTGFAVLAVVTTIGGAWDMVRLFQRLGDEKEDQVASDEHLEHVSEKS